MVFVTCVARHRDRDHLDLVNDFDNRQPRSPLGRARSRR